MPGVYRQPPNIPQPVRGVILAPEPFVAFRLNYRLDVWYTPLDFSPWQGQNKNKANISDEIFPLPSPPINWHTRIYPPYPTLQPRTNPLVEEQPPPVEIFIYKLPASRAYYAPSDLTAWWQNKNKANISIETIYFQSVKYPTYAPYPFLQTTRYNTLDQQPAPLEIFLFKSVASRVYFNPQDLIIWLQSRNKANISEEIFLFFTNQTAWLRQQLTPLFTRLRQIGIILPEQGPSTPSGPGDLPIILTQRNHDLNTQPNDLINAETNNTLSAQDNATIKTQTNRTINR